MREFITGEHCHVRERHLYVEYHNVCEPANQGQGEVIIGYVPRSSGCVSNNLTQREPKTKIKSSFTTGAERPDDDTPVYFVLKCIVLK